MVTPPPAALVRPGTVHTYEWTVPVGAGPVRGEADCLTYLYYSGVDPVKDTNSGLVGPLLVCRLSSLKKGEQVRRECWKLNVNFVDVNKLLFVTWINMTDDHMIKKIRFRPIESDIFSSDLWDILIICGPKSDTHLVCGKMISI